MEATVPSNSAESSESQTPVELRHIVEYPKEKVPRFEEKFMYVSCRLNKQLKLKHCISAAYIIPDIRHPVPSFPKVRPHAPNTIQTPPRNKLPLIGRIKQSVWSFGKRMTERDTKYAFKVGMAIGIMAAPAFFDATRPIFVEYWGDWALISVCPLVRNHLSSLTVPRSVLRCNLANNRSGMYSFHCTRCAADVRDQTNYLGFQRVLGTL